MRVDIPYKEGRNEYRPRSGRSSASLVGLLMAKKKAAKLQKTWKSKPVAFQVRASPEYKAVLERLAEFDGKSLASLADHSIREYARAVGFPETIPRR